MSIILGTLERLEAETPPPTNNMVINGSSRRASERMAHSTKTLAVTAVLAVSGAILVLWPQGDDASIRYAEAYAAAADYRVAADKTIRGLSLGSFQQTSVESAAFVEPVTMIRPAQVVQPAFPPTQVVSTGGESRAAPEQEPPEPDLPDGAVITAEESADTVAAAMEEPGVAPSPEDAQQVLVREISTGAAVQPYRVDEVIEKARLALSRGLYQQAISVLEAMEPIPEDRADFWLIKGSAHLGIGQLDLADDAFAAAQTLAPENVQIGVQQAIVKQEKGDHAGAVRILGELAGRRSDMPEIFLNLGYSQQALGHGRQARRSFRAFLEMTQGRSLYAEQRRAVSEWLAQADTGTF